MRIRTISMLFMFAFLIHGDASAGSESWSDTDTAWEAAFTAAALADWAQTREIARRPDEYHETNGLIGSHPSMGRVNAYFPALILGHYLVSRWLSPESRRGWQAGTFVVEAAWVGHNRAIGIRARF